MQPRENDLVIATHGRGIWIVDDITPLRALTTETLTHPATFLAARPVQQRMPAHGGWAEGDANYSGANPSSGAVITYYQRARHVFGPLKLEVLDDAGKLIDTVNASPRRGINRVVWSMQVKAPRVPRAAQLANNALQGPRVLPGTYTLRLTNGTEVETTKLVIGLDRRAPFNLADRKVQLDAAMRIHGMFGEMSTLVDRIEAAHATIGVCVQALPEGDGLKAKLRGIAGKLDAARMKVVATKEGGAVTGEERIREHLDELYGAINGWEGRPARYQVERIDVLARELKDVATELDTIVLQDVRPLDAELKSHHMDPIPTDASPRAPEATLAPGSAPDAAAALRCWHSRGLECEESVVGTARHERD